MSAEMEKPPAQDSSFRFEAPADNFSRGLLNVDIPELGETVGSGKVRDIWVAGDERIMVTTDRQSAYDRLICTVPGKGQVLNLLSAWWFEKTRRIIPNHLISIPHSNVMIARQAKETIPVEVVFRRFMAKSSTSTSIYHNYAQLDRRNIYGIDFPEGLMANSEFPMGTILTPTTKAKDGHDQELTVKEAKKIADEIGGVGTWDKIKTKGSEVFEYAYNHHKSRGLILVDTKFEFGLDNDDNLMLIDEIFTPDSSRFWKADTYQLRFLTGENPETFDKDIIRRWLAEHGFTGEGLVPKVPADIINHMAQAYQLPYQIITREILTNQNSNPEKIKESIFRYLSS